MGDLPLRTPIHRRLGGPLPRQLPNGTHAYLSAIFFNKYPHAGPLFHAVLVRLSTGYPPLIGKLHTRYSPVRRSPPVYCYTVLPLDLHVLSLSLAFILSQDQTLRCSNCFFISSARIPSLHRSPRSSKLTVLFIDILDSDSCTTCRIM